MEILLKLHQISYLYAVTLIKNINRICKNIDTGEY